jgi:hypothetical protein
MPDLTPTAYWECESASQWEETVPGSKGTPYRVRYGRLPPGAATEMGYTCECTGFKMRGTCRHLAEAIPHHCNWQQFVHGGAPTTTAVGGRQCPRCGGRVTARRHAI